MRKLMSLVALALAAGACVAAAAPAGTRGVVGAGHAGAVQAWSVQYMNGNETVTLTQALAAARSFNVIVALPNVYQPYVSQMKAANPSLQLFVYAKGPFTYDTTLPEAAYSHDAAGGRIQGVQYSTWLLNPLSSLAV